MPIAVLPLLVFASTVAVVVGAYWALVLRPEAKILDRLRPKSEVARSLRGVLKHVQRDSAVGPLNSLLARSGPIIAAVRTLLKQSGVPLTVSVFLLLSACVGLTGYLAVAILTGMALLGLLAAVIVTPLPYLYCSWRRTKRINRFEEQFPEAIDLIARALRAGHALPTGLGMVADELPAPVGAEFRTLYDEQNFGLAIGEAMRSFAARVPVLDARFFVTAVLTQRESGGNLAEVLDNLASVIRERFKVKRQVRVISAHGRITGIVLSALPPCLAVLIMILNPSHLRVLVDDPMGRHMIMAAIAMQVVGTLLIRHLSRIEY